MNKLFRNTWAVLTKKEKQHFSVLLVCDIVISILDILALAALLWIIQFYIQPGKNDARSVLPAWLSDNTVLFIAIFFFLFAIKNMIGYLIARSHYRFSSKVAIRISRNNLASYQAANYEHFVHTDSSVHIRQIALQPFEFCQYMVAGIQQMVTQLCLVLIALAAILIFNAKLFLLLLLVLLPPVMAVFFYIKNRMNRARQHIRTTNEKSFQYLLDALKGYVESNIYNRNLFFRDRFINIRKQFSTHLFDSISLQNLPSRMIEIFAILGLFILVAIVQWTGKHDDDMLLIIGAFMAAAYKIIPGVVKIINTAGQLKAYELALDDLIRDSEKIKQPADRSTHRGIDCVELKNISFEFPGRPVLNNFSLSLKKGDFIGITGASGKGKTTLLNILLGLLPAKKGDIIINHNRVNQDDLRRYWPSISYVRQQSFFIYDTIRRNITFEEEPAESCELERSLRVSGLEDLIETFPEKLDKIITENGKNISGGQQQRVAIARAVYKNADLIILDEPFNELDEVSETSVLGHFADMAKQGKIVVLVTHNQKSLSFCSKIISLDEQS